MYFPSVTQTLVLHCLIFINLQLVGNFPDSVLDFNLSALNGFSQKIFVVEAIDGDTSGPSSTTSLYSSVDWSQYFMSSSFALHFIISLPWKNKFETARDMCCHSVSVQESKTLLWVVWPCCSGFWLILGRISTGVLWPVWLVCRTWLFIIIISAYERNLHRSILVKKHSLAV